MKKTLALLLVLLTLFSLSACGEKTESAANSETPIVNSPAPAPAEKEKTKTPTLSSDTLASITDFEDFKDVVEKNFHITETQTGDGGVIIDLNTPSAPTKDDNNKTPIGNITPAIPTIDKVQKPDENKENPPAPTPEKDETKTPDTSEDAKTEDETTVTPPTPEKDPEPETEPETEPEKEKEEEQPVIQKPVYTYTTNQKHTKLHYTKRYLYSLLNAEQKSWYAAIDKAVTNLEESVPFNTKISEDRKYMIYFLYMFDNPEHFYLGATCTINNKGNNTSEIVFCYSDGEMSCRYGSSLTKINDELRTKVKNKKAVFEKEVNRILSTIPSNAPDVWKEKLIYDRILMDSYYNLNAKWDGIANDNWTAYGILVNKYGVCESYSEAFQTLCLYAGINCTGVVGSAGGGHKWNCVMLDGEWYMCDITFDDPIGGIAGDAYHWYFNLTSTEMAERNHDWSSSEWPVPNCTGTKYSFDYFK